LTADYEVARAAPLIVLAEAGSRWDGTAILVTGAEATVRDARAAIRTGR
jgi:hypothetical protein